MEQARNYTCRECQSPVPGGHKFCGTCGALVPPEVQNVGAEFFGPMQTPGKARLFLIRGDQGIDGLTYLLQGTEHVAGSRDAQILFEEDRWLNPRHANFFYRDDKLVVRDEGSLNGVYVRVRNSVPLRPGDHFLCGEQVFRLEEMPSDIPAQSADQTYFYASPRRPALFRVAQILVGGGIGMVVCAREQKLEIGREDCDMNFPSDIYMSARHARVEMTGEGEFRLVDTDSKNGTFVRIDGERELDQGDYLFVGHQLLRVEMTTI